MTRPVRIGVQIWPGGTPDYQAWRDAVLRAEDMDVDVVFGYDHFHKPFAELTSEGPILLPEQPDVYHQSVDTSPSSEDVVDRIAELPLVDRSSARRRAAGRHIKQFSRDGAGR